MQAGPPRRPERRAAQQRLSPADRRRTLVEVRRGTRQRLCKAARKHCVRNSGSWGLTWPQPLRLPGAALSAATCAPRATGACGHRGWAAALRLWSMRSRSVAQPSHCLLFAAAAAAPNGCCFSCWRHGWALLHGCRWSSPPLPPRSRAVRLLRARPPGVVAAGALAAVASPRWALRLRVSVALYSLRDAGHLPAQPSRAQLPSPRSGCRRCRGRVAQEARTAAAERRQRGSPAR